MLAYNKHHGNPRVHFSRVFFHVLGDMFCLCIYIYLCSLKHCFYGNKTAVLSFTKLWNKLYSRYWYFVVVHIMLWYVLWSLPQSSRSCACSNNRSKHVQSILFDKELSRMHSRMCYFTMVFMYVYSKFSCCSRILFAWLRKYMYPRKLGDLCQRFLTCLFFLFCPWPPFWVSFVSVTCSHRGGVGREELFALFITVNCSI